MLINLMLHAGYSSYILYFFFNLSMFCISIKLKLYSLIWHVFEYENCSSLFFGTIDWTREIVFPLLYAV